MQAFKGGSWTVDRKNGRRNSSVQNKTTGRHSERRVWTDGRTDPAVQPVSDVTKITVVFAVLSTTTKLVKRGLIVFETVEDGFVKFSWNMVQMCVEMCEVCVLLQDTR
jgi:hypothetical protein